MLNLNLGFIACLILSVIGSVHASSVGLPVIEDHFSSGSKNGKGCSGFIPLLAESKPYVFDNYIGQDPYDLEDAQQEFFRQQKFENAAVRLIASALNGFSDNLDYMLKIQPQALTYIQSKNRSQTDILIKQVTEDLARQFEDYQKPPVPLDFLLMKKGF